MACKICHWRAEHRPGCSKWMPNPEAERAAISAIERELNAMIEPGATTTLWTLAEAAGKAAVRAYERAKPY